MFWTADHDDIAAARWADGDTARVIGEALGVSRNAVIGRAHRKGWCRPGPVRPPRAVPVACAVKVPRKKASPRLPRRGKPVPPTRPVVADRPALPEDWPITILTVTSGSCRFPLADRWPWPLCGEPAVGPAPYCAEHCSICYGARR